MSDESKDRGTILVILTLLLAVVMFAYYFETSNQVVDVNKNDPYLVAQYRVGDDTVPHVHQVWCVDGLVSKSAVDNSPFCYVEVIDDWEWEGVE